MLLMESDLLAEKHFPVIPVINEACSFDFIKFMENINNSVGMGYNYASCSFYNDLDDYDKQNIKFFNGILFSTINNEDLVLSFEEFFYYLKLVALRIPYKDFEHMTTVVHLLNEYKSKYLNM